MKALVIAVALVGCSSPKHADAPTALAPADRCHKAADQLVELMSAAVAATPEAIKEITDKVVARCQTDAWSEQATTCIIGLRDKNELVHCEGMFTEAQKTALVGAFGGNDGEAGGGAAPPTPAPASAMPESAPGAPPPTTRGPAKKDDPPKHKSDPCEGGQ